MSPTSRSRRTLPVVSHQLGVFTTAQAARRGWGSEPLRHAARIGRIDRLWRGVYAEPCAPDHAGRDRRQAQLAVAAAITNEGVLVSHGGAATVNGWRWWAPEPHACVSHGPELGVTHLPGLHVHRAHLGRFDRWRTGTVPVTSPGRTVCDVAREYGTEAGLCLADAAAQAGDLRPADLRRAIAQARDWPGGRRLPRLVELLDPRSESVLETRSRWAMPGVGIPPPLTQVLLSDRTTGFVARVDFFWPEFGVVGEADGNVKYEEKRDVTAEKEREDAVRRLVLGVVRWGWQDLGRFEVVSDRFWQAVDDQARYRSLPRRWVAQQLPITPYRHGPAVGPALVGVGGVITAR